ncbi:HD domain-containing protein [Mucilaginibacter sp. CSA2-8R]|uniref:HD domain-containing protein n=1 Tax=Mucilaginibacter sp. CSA2-8R TaxID=3141542 RepID=UPI00315DE443
MDSEIIIQNTVSYVQQTLQNAEGGHDWWHILRVWNNAKLIARSEPVNLLVVELAALLHDIADSKFNNGNEDIGPQTAVTFLQSQSVNIDIIHHVENIIRHMSFKASFDAPGFHSPELAVVQDADRLDAIGAIGIARAFTYGGFKGRELYNPRIEPNLNMSKSEYKASAAPTINHFYEKLLLLKNKMNTPTAKTLAEARHQYMQDYLDQFYAEWNSLK